MIPKNCKDDNMIGIARSYHMRRYYAARNRRRHRLERETLMTYEERKAEKQKNHEDINLAQ